MQIVIDRFSLTMTIGDNDNDEWALGKTYWKLRAVGDRMDLFISQFNIHITTEYSLYTLLKYISKRL